jgi:hypothetical protein
MSFIERAENIMSYGKELVEGLAPGILLGLLDNCFDLSHSV